MGTLKKHTHPYLSISGSHIVWDLARLEVFKRDVARDLGCETDTRLDDTVPCQIDGKDFGVGTSGTTFGTILHVCP